LPPNKSLGFWMLLIFLLLKLKVKLFKKISLVI
jgi:hypothetical protein